jgi:hypothetical protein
MINAQVDKLEDPGRSRLAQALQGGLVAVWVAADLAHGAAGELVGLAVEVARRPGPRPRRILFSTYSSVHPKGCPKGCPQRWRRLLKKADRRLARR